MDKQQLTTINTDSTRKSPNLSLDMHIIENNQDKSKKSSGEQNENITPDNEAIMSPPESKIIKRRSLMNRFRDSAKKDIMSSLLSSANCSSKTSLNTDDSGIGFRPEQSPFTSEIDASLIISPLKQKKRTMHFQSAENFSKHRPKILPNSVNNSSLSINTYATNLAKQDKENMLLTPSSSSSYFQRYNFTASSEKVFYEKFDDDDVFDADMESAHEQDMKIRIINGNFNDYYEELEILGMGSSATVKKCMKVKTGEVYAVKISSYRGETERLQMCKKEFLSHHKLDHKNIVKVYELFIDVLNKKVYLIMELVQGKEMSDIIQAKGAFNESTAAYTFKQILGAIAYLHTKGVCHRDIKPNNILISDDGKTIKITDFGVSKFCADYEIKRYSSLNKANYKMWTQTGTKSFNSPEYFLEAEYTEAIDMWSAGVTLYIMLTGLHPFETEYLDDQINKIINADYDLETGTWTNISQEAKSLVKACLKKDYRERLTPSQALMHPWILKYSKGPNDILNIFKEPESSSHDSAILSNPNECGSRISFFDDGLLAKFPNNQLKKKEMSMSCSKKKPAFLFKDEI